MNVVEAIDKRLAELEGVEGLPAKYSRNSLRVLRERFAEGDWQLPPSDESVVGEDD